MSKLPEEQICEHGVSLVGGFCSRCIEVMCQQSVKGPSELEMHRLAYQMCKNAGFEGPEEVLAAYKAAEQRNTELSATLEDMRNDLGRLWGLAAKYLLSKP